MSSENSTTLTTRFLFFLDANVSQLSFFSQLKPTQRRVNTLHASFSQLGIKYRQLLLILQILWLSGQASVPFQQVVGSSAVCTDSFAVTVLLLILRAFFLLHYG
jgi:hypothetical protein